MNQVVFVVPTFNRAKIIQKTLKINAQIVERYDGVEVIVIDNCSDDKTFNLLSSEYSENSNISILMNTKNIGFKGQIKRIVSERMFREKLCVVLSDEDVIFEPGLISFLTSSSYKKLILNSLYVFNFLNAKGKDSFFRRKKRKVLNINDIEIFGFGYISGFAFFLDKDYKFDINPILKSENSYPHLFPALFQNMNVEVVGEAIVANLINDEQSFLSNEWASGKHHFHLDSVKDFLRFIEKEFKVSKVELFIFSVMYKSVAGLYRSVGLKKYVSAGGYFLLLLLVKPKLAIYYLFRYFN
jgi:glycosyltransferase involved in cell wall biosynthesis